MALTGKGAILIWNDITPEGRAEFYDWHLNEHIPERVAIPGFLSGRRFIRATAETTPEFFTLYETNDFAVTTSAPYLARLNAPTDWTRRATSQFRNTERALTRVLLSVGQGQGGALATVRFGDDAAGLALFKKLHASGDRLAGLARKPRITGVHACEADSTASAARTAESRERTDIKVPPVAALIVEGCDVAAVQDLVTEALAMCEVPAAGVAIGYYLLEHTRSKVGA